VPCLPARPRRFGGGRRRRRRGELVGGRVVGIWGFWTPEFRAISEISSIYGGRPFVFLFCFGGSFFTGGFSLVSPFDHTLGGDSGEDDLCGIEDVLLKKFDS